MNIHSSILLKMLLVILNTLLTSTIQRGRVHKPKESFNFQIYRTLIKFVPKRVKVYKRIQTQLQSFREGITRILV